MEPDPSRFPFISYPAERVMRELGNDSAGTIQVVDQLV